MRKNIRSMTIWPSFNSISLRVRPNVVHDLLPGMNRPRQGSNQQPIFHGPIMALVDINWHPSPKELRVFAVLQLVFFSIVAWAVQQRAGSAGWAVAILVATAIIGLVGLIKPRWLRLIYVVWMAAVFPIGLVVSHLLMAAVFYLVVTPIGLIMRLLGRDPMHRKLDREAATYWQPRHPARGTRGYFRQF